MYASSLTDYQASLAARMRRCYQYSFEYNQQTVYQHTLNPHTLEYIWQDEREGLRHMTLFFFLGLRVEHRGISRLLGDTHTDDLLL